MLPYTVEEITARITPVAKKYGLKIGSSNFEPPDSAEWEYHIILLDTDTELEAVDTGPTIPASVQYYSATVQNDVFFSFYNTSSEPDIIRYKGGSVSGKDCFFTKDGLGVVLPGRFLEQAENDGAPIALEFEMKNGMKAFAEVIPIP